MPKTMERPGRRHRTPLACVTCRRRKTKCDGARPRCRHCASRDIACLWVDGSPDSGSQATSPATPHSVASRCYDDHQGGCQDSGPSNVRLPARGAMTTCIEIFFEKHASNTFCSFLYKQDITDENVSAPFLFSAMLSLCGRYLSPQQATADYGLASGLLVSHLYAPMARHLARLSSDQPSVQNIQANLILAVSEFVDNEGSSHWMYSGTAIRMAQIMRLNVGFNERHSLKEREIRRRTMWASVFVDSWLSQFLGKPPMPMANILAFLPGSDASIAFGEPSRGLTLDSIEGFTGYASDLGLLAYLTATVAFWSDVTNVVCRNPRFFYKQAPTDPSSPFRLSQDKMLRWAGRLPTSLRWSEDSYRRHSTLGQGRDFVLMHMLIRSAVCIGNQAYLPQLDSTSILQDLVDAAGWPLLRDEPKMISDCVTSALEIARIAAFLFEGGESARRDIQSVHVAALLFSSANTLLWIQYSNYQGDYDVNVVKEAGAHFDRYVEIMASWQDHWKSATRWLYALRAMRALYRAAYIGELDSAMGEMAAPPSGTGEGTMRYRPMPGDGYPPAEPNRHLQDCLRLFSSDVSVDSGVLRDMWMQFAMGWSQNLASLDEVPEFINS